MATQALQVTEATPDNDQYEVLEVAMADSKIPSMKVNPNTGWVNYGDKNDYPDYVNMLYLKSATHQAAINGKITYIFGGGLQPDQDTPQAAQFLAKANESEGWDSIAKQLISDIRNYGGSYLQIIPRRGGGYNVYNTDFGKWRTNEDATWFYFKKDWTKRWSKSDQELPKFYPGIREASIMLVKEHRPEADPYPLPDWCAAANWVETDVEVSKHTLTNAKTGFSASKFINFYNGEPPEPKKASIQRRLVNAATGAEGMKLLIGYNNDPAKKPTVDDLGESDLTRENFGPVNDLINSKIFIGHSITHPMLFGVQQEGKLGNATELRIAYEIFKNTYVNEKRQLPESVVNYFASIAGVQQRFTFKDVEAVGIEITSELILSALTKDEKRELIGYDKEIITGNSVISNAINSLSPLVANKVLESMSPDEIRSLAGLSPKGADQIPSTPQTGLTQQQQGEGANSILTNLTGRQQQQVLRLVRLFSTGKMSEKQAVLMLTSGFGMTEDQAKTMLGIEDQQAQQFSQEFDETDVALMFAECGEDREGFTVIKSKPYAADDDEFQFAFGAVAELTEVEKKIAEIVKKDPKINNESIAQALNLPVSKIDILVNKLTEDGVLTAPAANGIRKITEPGIKSKLPAFLVRYSYEKRPEVPGPELLPTSRPFCQKLIGLNRLYTRAEIQQISQRLGYNVFDRAGGFWNHNGKTETQCRHEWRSQIVIKKK